MAHGIIECGSTESIDEIQLHVCLTDEELNDLQMALAGAHVKCRSSGSDSSGPWYNKEAMGQAEMSESFKCERAIDRSNDHTSMSNSGDRTN